MAISDRIRAAFTENINLKLLSIGFTLVLYSLVHGAQDAQRVVSVDLVLLLPPSRTSTTRDSGTMRRPAPRIRFRSSASATWSLFV